MYPVRVQCRKYQALPIQIDTLLYALYMVRILDWHYVERPVETPIPNSYSPFRMKALGGVLGQCSIDISQGEHLIHILIL